MSCTITDSLGEGRPFSRRGVKEDNQTNLSSRSASLDRSPKPASASANGDGNSNSWRQPSTAFRLQGTASRLASANVQQRPLSIRALPLPTRASQSNVTDRLVTQQGLSRVRSSRSASQGLRTRQVQDKRYYAGMLQLKMREISAEVSAMREEMHHRAQEQEAFAIYDNRVKKLASELTALQGTLADYNLVVDKVNMRTDAAEVERECLELAGLNEKEQNKLERAMMDRMQIQQKVDQLEAQIENERLRAEKVMREMSPEWKVSYEEMQKKNEQLRLQIEEMHEESEYVTARKQELEKELSSSPMKWESLELHLTLWEWEGKRDKLLKDDGEIDLDPEKLTDRVQWHHEEISTMERIMNELKGDIKRAQKESADLQKEMDQLQSDQHNKYVELRKREESMEAFLADFDATIEKESGALKELKEEIAAALYWASKHLLILPASQAEYDFLRKDLSKIGDDGVGSEESHLHIQYKRRRLYLEKLECLETKLKNEIEGLREHLCIMREDLVKYENVDSLKKETDEKLRALAMEKETLVKARENARLELEALKMEFGQIRERLENNETHLQIQALDKKLKQVEQNNMDLREIIQRKREEMAYEDVKEESLQLVRHYNEILLKK